MPEHEAETKPFDTCGMPLIGGEDEGGAHGGPAPLDEVLDCEAHGGYSVEHRLEEEVDWDAELPDSAEGALRGYIEAEVDPALAAQLAFRTSAARPRLAEYVARFADGSVHGVVTVACGGEPARWAVTHAAVCTLEEVPDEDPEDDGYGDLDDREVLAENRPPV